MKKLLCLCFLSLLSEAGQAQKTKAAYQDMYQRGGGQHLRTTLIMDHSSIYLGRKNLGEVLNLLSGFGWQVDQTLIGAKRGFPNTWITRHKFHIILKKDYLEGTDPFRELRINRT